jgi:hypothetical protein
MFFQLYQIGNHIQTESDIFGGIIMQRAFTFSIIRATIRGCMLLAFLLFSGVLSAHDQKDCCSSVFSVGMLKQVSLEELAREYRRLRKHSCKDCFKWSSGLQLVMSELGVRLEDKSKTIIRKNMGRPDEKKGNQWIYDWRNGHDYLFFEFIEGRAKAQWYYAYE